MVILCIGAATTTQACPGYVGASRFRRGVRRQAVFTHAYTFTILRRSFVVILASMHLLTYLQHAPAKRSSSTASNKTQQKAPKKVKKGGTDLWYSSAWWIDRPALALSKDRSYQLHVMSKEAGGESKVHDYGYIFKINGKKNDRLPNSEVRFVCHKGATFLSFALLKETMTDVTLQNFKGGGYTGFARMNLPPPPRQQGR